jgi:hypothetical protein
MRCVEHQSKGLRRMVCAEVIGPGRLDVHPSEIGPDTRAHPAHAHDGVEAFVVPEGAGRLRRLVITAP